jgi:hypothetical protein
MFYFKNSPRYTEYKTFLLSAYYRSILPILADLCSVTILDEELKLRNITLSSLLRAAP